MEAVQAQLETREVVRARLAMRCAPLLWLVALVLLLGCSTYRRQAGTGDVAFRLAWNGESDLDLFVEDPGGTCISFVNRESGTGGILDVDCNAGTDRLCANPVENVYWPRTAAPAGEYRFWVHAHALIPAEAPLELQVQVMLGERVIWYTRHSMREHDELLGPFEYRFPDGEVVGPRPDGELPPECADPFRSFLDGLRQSG